MSKISIQGASTGTGVFTLASPATNTDRTLVLPDEAGTVLTSAGVPASALPAGSVLQVVQVLNTTDTTVTAQIDFITASITPSSASNKILVMGNLASVARRSSGNSEGYYFLVRNGSSLGPFDGIAPWNNGNTEPRSIGSMHVQYLDSPSSTSSVTYSLSMYVGGGSVNINNEGGISSLTLMEIAG